MVHPMVPGGERGISQDEARNVDVMVCRCKESVRRRRRTITCHVIHYQSKPPLLRLGAHDKEVFH